MTANIIRALRLPFITASILPFIFGSLLAGRIFKGIPFLLGLACAACAHLSANVINDYADSKSGADWQDRKFYGLFGGSKLIQENVLSERFYLRLAVIFLLISFFCAVLMSILLKNLMIIVMYLAIMILAWLYSVKPVQFSYRMLGECIIFILFGPALVMGGYYIQTGILISGKSILLSLPFGFFTTAILFANEIPDFSTDKSSGKNTWVNLLGLKDSFVLYYLLMSLGFLAIALALFLGYLGWPAAVSLLFILPVLKAGRILKEDYQDKMKLIQSSKTTIAIQAWVSIILILDLMI